MKYTTINVQVTKSFKKMAHKKAKSEDLSLSQLIRKLLKEYKSDS